MRSWDDKNLSLPLRVCDVCGKAWYMNSVTCAPCTWWRLRLEAAGERDR